MCACSSCRIVNVCVVPRVSESVGQNRRQLQSVTERIQLAQARVDKIKGSKKATKVPPHRNVSPCDTQPLP